MMLMENKRNILLYALIVIVVAAVAFLVVYTIAAPGSYPIKVKLQPVGYNSSQGIYPYQTMYFNLVLTNYGRYTIKNMPVAVYVNNVLYAQYNATIPGNLNVTAHLNYTYPYNGTYVFKAVADPAGILKITNPSLATSIVKLNVSEPETPNLFTTLPNVNATYIKTFSLVGQGPEISSIFANTYNLSSFEKFFEPGYVVVDSLLTQLIPEIYVENGAYLHYANNSTALSEWIQTSANGSDVAYLLSKYGLRTKEFGPGSSPSFISVLTNKTSICVTSDSGWTKLLAYFNNSEPQTCQNIIEHTYSPTYANTLKADIAGSNTLQSISTNLQYANSTFAGKAVTINSTNMSVTNIFYNGFGFFASYVRQHPPINSFNQSCRGLLYSNATTKVSACSVYMIPANGINTQNFSLVNTTQVTSNYSMSLYSFVNSTNLINAHYNAVKLIGSLHLNETPFAWFSPFKNTCETGIPGLGCAVKSYNQSDSKLSLRLSNGLQSGIRINTLGCYLLLNLKNESVNAEIMPNSTLDLNATCSGIASSAAAVTTNYTMVLNYTLENKTSQSKGYADVVNSYFP